MAEAGTMASGKGPMHEARTRDAAPQPAALLRELGRSGGRPLDADVAAHMQSRLGHDFGAVRVHADGAAAGLAAGFGARAFTVGPHIGFASGRYAPRSESGSRLLAHELVHTLQQQGPARGRPPHLQDVAAAEAQAQDWAAAGPGGGRPQQGLAGVPQFDLESPDRLAVVHDNIFPAAPVAGAGAGSTGSSTASSRPWVPASATGGGTAALIKQQVRAAIQHLVDTNSDQVAEPPTNTNEADVDNDVLTANTRLRSHFPQISVTVTDAELQTAAGLLSGAETNQPRFQNEWLWNTLPSLCDIAQFAIQFGDPDAVTLRTELLADSFLGLRLRTMSRRVAGLNTGTGTGRVIRVNRGVNALQRGAVLVHELVHMFAHDAYTRWVATTANDDLYDEGITEWLARRVMTADERALPTRYTPRVQRVETEIVPHVSEDDIALAYFRGEVWRLENRSSIARDQFAAASGIAVGANESQENTQSRSGPGLNQEVRPDALYRFLNLGHDVADPKPEHVDYFHRLKARLLDPQPTVTVKFVGHASSPGTRAHNDGLSLQRAQAFYRMARAEGLNASRLRDETPPEHHGELVPTLNEEDAQTRAFNRRVEMQLSGASATPGVSTGTPTGTTAPARKDY